MKVSLVVGFVYQHQLLSIFLPKKSINTNLLQSWTIFLAKFLPLIHHTAQHCGLTDFSKKYKKLNGVQNMKAAEQQASRQAMRIGIDKWETNCHAKKRSTSSLQMHVTNTKSNHEIYMFQHVSFTCWLADRRTL